MRVCKAPQIKCVQSKVLFSLQILFFHQAPLPTQLLVIPGSSHSFTAHLRGVSSTSNMLHPGYFMPSTALPGIRHHESLPRLQHVLCLGSCFHSSPPQAILHHAVSRKTEHYKSNQGICSFKTSQWPPVVLKIQTPDHSLQGCA